MESGESMATGYHSFGIGQCQSDILRNQAQTIR